MPEWECWLLNRHHGSATSDICASIYALYAPHTRHTGGVISYVFLLYRLLSSSSLHGQYMRSPSSAKCFPNISLLPLPL